MGISSLLNYSRIAQWSGRRFWESRQFAVATEENPYLYKAIPGKEKDLMIPVAIFHLDIMQYLLTSHNGLTEEKKKQFEIFRKGLIKLKEGHTMQMA